MQVHAACLRENKGLRLSSSSEGQAEICSKEHWHELCCVRDFNLNLKSVSDGFSFLFFSEIAVFCIH